MAVKDTSLGRPNRNQYPSYADSTIKLGGAGGPLSSPPNIESGNWGDPVQTNAYNATPRPRPFPQSAWGSSSQPSYTAPAWNTQAPTPTWGQSPAPEPPSANQPDWGQLAPTSWQEWITKTPEWQTGAGNYFATQLPIQQYLQNAQQYGQDFAESQRRFNEQAQWQQALDAYNAMLAGRQQQLAEGQTASAADQWTQQFAYQRGLDQRSMDLERELQSLNAFGRSVTPGARFVRNWG